ncbi:MAG: peptidylprolyl isomerase [Verrucomicrobiota bacterium]|jgi:parvulin-like peptidyl-prolyl isomerase
MKSNFKIIFSAALALALFVLPRAQADSDNSTTNATSDDAMTKLFGDPVVAKGTGFEIKQSQLDKVMVGVKATAAMRGQQFSPEQAKLVESEMLNRLIQIQLLLQQATDADKAAGEDQFEKSLQELKTNQKLTDAEFDQKLSAQLQLQNVTRAEWEKENIDQATVLAVLKRALNLNITDADAKSFYDAHATDFEQPEMAHVRHILLMTIDPDTRSPLPADQQQAKRKQIDDLLKRARGGEDFATLASEYSEDPGSKDAGGELPPFARGQMVAEFEAAAFSLNTNQISDVVTTVYGYHIIKLLDKIPAKTIEFTGVDTKVAGLSGGQPVTIRDVLTAQTIQAQAPKYLLGLRKAADVQILDADLKAVMDEQTNAPPAAAAGN